MRYFLELSYNGKRYHGWQIQPNANSVQQTVESALSTLLKRETSIVGAGRTDSGVHAKQLFAHFDTASHLDCEQLSFKLNAFLPKDIVIHRIFEVDDTAHARFDALSRTYLYRIALEKNAFNFENTYLVTKSLDMNAMKDAAAILFEYTNFQCFSKHNTDVKTYNCNIMQATFQQNDTELHFTITANRFLRNMVRAIVGTLINVGLHKITSDDLHTIIQSKNRSEAGFSVPAHALYLVEVTYPKSIVNG